ncbi:MAG: transposase, partial [Nanoarchaeota archaeon]
KYLVRRLPHRPNKIVADKGYDANWVHKLCYSLSILAVIPARDYGSKKIPRYNTKYRKRGMKLFRKRTYNRREVIESVISAFKRKFGASVSSVKLSAQRAELYCRAIAHNIIFCFYGLFERSHLKRINIYIVLFSVSSCIIQKFFGRRDWTKISL